MKKLLSLTGIRAIAAAWVVLFHFMPMFDYGFLNPLAQKGYLGVDLFFVLSGFIISYVHHKDFQVFNIAQMSRFLVLRIARILPVHYFMLFTFAGFFVLKGLLLREPVSFETAGTFRDFMLNLFNVQAWGFSDHNSWNYVAWSVSAEWFAYLTFPLLSPWIQRCKSVSANLWLIAGCFAFLTVFSLALGLENLGWTFQYALIRISAEFIAGCALYNVFQKTADKQSEWWTVLPLLGLLLGIWSKMPDIACVLLMLPLIYGLAKGQGALAKLLATRPLVHLGEISFSIYMVHGFIYDRLHPLDQKIHFITEQPGVQNVVIFTLIMLGIVGAAQLLFQYVEVPCRNHIRSLLTRGSKVHPSSSTPAPPLSGVMERAL